MSLVDSNWDMWNTPLRAEGQRDAVHKCWCYCRNSRSCSVAHIWTPKNWEAWLWTFGNLNSPILGWGTQGTFDHGLFCESNASKKIAGCFIMIFLNCIGSFRTWSNNKLLEPAPCSPNCVQVECEYFRFCDLYVYESLSLSLYICVYIHIQYILYIYIYIFIYIYIYILYTHTYTCDSLSWICTHSLFPAILFGTHYHCPPQLAPPRGRALSMPDAGSKAWRTWGCCIPSPWYQGWPALHWTYPISAEREGPNLLGPWEFWSLGESANTF